VFAKNEKLSSFKYSPHNQALLGSGSSGQVYKIFDDTTAYVVKIVEENLGCPKRDGADSNVRYSALKEAFIGKKLSDHHGGQFIKHVGHACDPQGKHKRRVFIVFEHVQGTTL
jgi:serine/threonine protein kinase